MPVIMMKYKVYKGKLVPIVTLGIKHKETWYVTEAYVVSGATYSIFSHKFSDRIGLDIKGGKLIYAQVGDGGCIPTYLHDLEVQLGEERFTCTVGLSEKLGIGFNLLGRAGLFDQFKVCFDEKKYLVTFESHL